LVEDGVQWWTPLMKVQKHHHSRQIMESTTLIKHFQVILDENLKKGSGCWEGKGVGGTGKERAITDKCLGRKVLVLFSVWDSFKLICLKK